MRRREFVALAAAGSLFSISRAATPRRIARGARIPGWELPKV